jgi:type I restriction-modification system DNA methylase subunit
MAMASIEERGAVFTRREVVEFILDLVGYTTEKPLHKARILEPAVGQGDFLLPTIERLLDAYGRARKPVRRDVVADLGDCLHAIELHRSSFDETRSLVVDALREKDFNARVAAGLADRWLHQGDFLLVPIVGAFSHVVGNPPYVRQERIPDALMEEYRRRYSTIFDRADIYIPFIERSLSLLAPDGRLGFICADRWMKNRYGGPLRRMVAERLFAPRL